ncbi:hypothetical protein [Kitasatospora sp. NPDC098663]|uniref:hypothetical protein n=1 Tax=Kitasatospora sp. NPDC098663 TaxID=3364096 RepID=UPI00382FDBF8
MAYKSVSVHVSYSICVTVEVDDSLGGSEKYLQANRLGVEAAKRGEGAKSPKSYTPTSVADGVYGPFAAKTES